MLLINRKTHTDTHAGSQTVVSTKYHTTGNFCRHPAELANVLKAAVEYIFCLHVLTSPPPPPPLPCTHRINLTVICVIWWMIWPALTFSLWITCRHTNVHAHKHTQACTHRHTDKHTFMHAVTFHCHWCGLVNDMTFCNFLSLSHRLTHRHTCMHTDTRMHAHTHMYAHKYTYIHMHSHNLRIIRNTLAACTCLGLYKSLYDKLCTL